LNNGQLGKLIQSTTAPCMNSGALNNRSAKFPQIPPVNEPKPSAHSGCEIFGTYQIIAISAAIARIVKSTVSPVNELNAAPELRANSKRKKSPITDREFFPSSVLVAQTLVAKSKIKINRAVPLTIFILVLINVFPLFACRSCKVWHEGILAIVLYQWDFRSLHTFHTSLQLFDQAHVQFA